MSLVNQHVGEIAALGTATCWVFTSLAFAAAGRRIGPTAVNLIRILIAWVVLVVIHRVVVATWIPPADAMSVMLLAISGVLGFAICDQFAFCAFVDVGARMTTLLMTLTPPVAAVLAWIFLGEPLDGVVVAGIAITLSGIIWVALERPDPGAHRPHPHRVRGLIFGALAGFFQATGLILSKLGIGHTRLAAEQHLDPWSASLVRVTFGAAAICALTLIYRAGRSATATGASAGLEPASEPTSVAFRESVWPRALLQLTIGAILGPVIGVWLSLVAVDRAEAGIAATLMAMTPVLILPMAAWIERERIGCRAILGAGVAALGVTVLTLHSRMQAWIQTVLEGIQ
jgi:drug/metabolite transporter (DMT)-like permease